MREIIFRGRRIDNGEWVEGAYCKHDTVKACTSTDAPKTKHLILVDGFYGRGLVSALIGREVDPATVSQFTGLYDKNGKRIWDGDICQIKDHPLIYNAPFVVEWEDFVYNGWTWRDLDEDGEVFSFTSGAAKICEVIGNKWDNPELLGGAE